EFISKTIIESAKNIDIFPREEVINLSSLKNIKLIEVLDILSSKKNLKYKLAGEEPIINYYPSINKLKYYLKKLDLQEEDTEKILINYFS
ncbi:epimerase, partial [Clostridium sporogenes]|nr:epimerase [Clostridium sporogenes]